MFHLASKFREIIRFDKQGGIPSDPEKAPILNFLAWPDEVPTDTVAADLIRDRILNVRQVETPGLYDRSMEIQHPEYQFWRVRALTAMRKQLVEYTNVRICIGGASGQATRRLPGVIEEALLTAQAQRPLYLIGAIGGASRAMANAVLQRTMSNSERDMFYSNPECTVRMERYRSKYPYEASEGPSYEADGEWSAMHAFQSLQLNDLAKTTGLDVDEYIRMMTAPDVERAMRWVGKGAANLAVSMQG